MGFENQSTFAKLQLFVLPLSMHFPSVAIMPKNNEEERQEEEANLFYKEVGGLEF